MKKNGYYTVDCSGNAIYSGREFSSRRKAQEYITKIRAKYPMVVRERRKFEIRWVSTAA